jgi:sugar lactone lactonase YvrE
MAYENKSEEKTFTPRAPDYSGNGVAIWKAEDQNGNVYLKVSVLGGKAINCFKVEERPKVEKQKSI